MKVQFTNDLNNTFDEIHNYSYNNILTDSETFSFVEEDGARVPTLGVARISGYTHKNALFTWMPSIRCYQRKKIEN